MLKISNQEELKNIVNENKIVIIYFSNNACGACEVIKGKVNEILMSYPEIKSVEIKGEEQIQLATMYDVFSFPVLLLYVDGKETIRVGRNVNLLDLEKNISRYYEMIYV